MTGVLDGVRHSDRATGLTERLQASLAALGPPPLPNPGVVIAPTST